MCRDIVNFEFKLQIRQLSDTFDSIIIFNTFQHLIFLMQGHGGGPCGWYSKGEYFILSLSLFYEV